MPLRMGIGWGKIGGTPEGVALSGYLFAHNLAFAIVRLYVEGDPAFNVHNVVDDDSTVEGCVTVENAADKRFPVPATLVDDICEPVKKAQTPCHAHLHVMPRLEWSA